MDDRTKAETLRGRMIFVREADAEPPPDGGYYIHDLIGCRVLDAAGEPVGTLTDVVGTPAQDLWAVSSGEKVHHIPAVKEFIVSVDIGKKEIVVNLPEGLID